MPPENLEDRVTALEVQVGELRGQIRASARDATAARVLAGAADRDVEEIRGEIRDFRQATIASFNAVRADISDLQQQITGILDLDAHDAGALDGGDDIDLVILEMVGDALAGDDQVAVLELVGQ